MNPVPPSREPRFTFARRSQVCWLSVTAADAVALFGVVLGIALLLLAGSVQQLLEVL